jgi:hypothetical protein
MDGPGIPEAAAHILQPFSTTKPVGKAPAWASTFSWRIRRPARPRRPAVHANPGDTRFQVCCR